MKMEKMDVITLTTDMGWEYAAQMKGVIISINPKARIIDVTHSISPQKIYEGAFVLYSAVKYFPPAIHIGVVDPGVGTARKGIIVECDKGMLVGPDNGLLIPAGKLLGLKGFYEIKEKSISQTFHGRDIFAPAAARLSLGIEPSELGEPMEKYEEISFGEPRELESGIKGKIIFIDRFGNLITNIPKDILKFRYGEKMKIKIKTKIKKGDRIFSAKFLKSYGFAKEKELLVAISSSNFLEISCNRGRASDILKMDIGDEFALIPS
jgi:hypothetical protein